MSTRKQFGKGPKKQGFIESKPDDSLATSDIAMRCKFNFSYLDQSQEAGQSFVDWNTTSPISQLSKLNDKLREYSRESLKHWTRMGIGTGKKGGKGKRQNVLEIYGDFPKKSDFTHPKSVPADVKWSRFRLEGSVRLIGFVIPDELHGKSDKDGNLYDSNTFYVVFLDKNHKFYLT